MGDLLLPIMSQKVPARLHWAWGRMVLNATQPDNQRDNHCQSVSQASVYLAVLGSM